MIHIGVLFYLFQIQSIIFLMINGFLAGYGYMCVNPPGWVIQLFQSQTWIDTFQLKLEISGTYQTLITV